MKTKRFKNLLAALDWLRQQGVEYVETSSGRIASLGNEAREVREFSYTSYYPCAIDELQYDCGEYTRFQITHVLDEKMIVDYAESEECGKRRAEKRKEQRLLKEADQAKQNPFLAAEFREMSAMQDVIWSLARGEKPVEISNIDACGNRRSIVLIAAWRGSGGAIIDRLGNVQKAGDWVRRMKESRNSYDVEWARAVEREMEKQAEQGERFAEAHRKAAHVWFSDSE